MISCVCKEETVSFFALMTQPVFAFLTEPSGITTFVVNSKAVPALASLAIFTHNWIVQKW